MLDITILTCLQCKGLSLTNNHAVTIVIIVRMVQANIKSLAGDIPYHPNTSLLFQPSQG